MLGLYSLSTHPLSQIGLPQTPTPATTGGAGSGADDIRRLTPREKRRRKRHAAQMAHWAREYQRLLDGPDITPEVAAVARVVVERGVDAPQAGDLARSLVAQLLPAQIVFRAPAPDQRAALADVAMALRRVVSEVRAARELAEDDDEVALVLGMI